jgi:hypothetical protein
VKAVKLGEESVGVLGDVFIIFSEDFAKKLMLGVVNGLDNVLVISGKVKKAAALTRGAQLREYIFARQGHEIISRVQTESISQVAEDPRGIVFELEVVLG